MTTPTEAARLEPSGRRSRRRWWIGGAAVLVVLVAVAAVVLVVFQPQRLFIDDTVDEALPVAAGPATPSTAAEPGAPPSSAPPQPVVVLSGSFISRDHGTSGVANVLDVDGTTYLRIEDLDTDNGPDLYVYLAANPAEGPEDAFDDDIVDLGRLKGNVGNQNYEIPPDVDLTHYRSVVIWCDRFDAAFGAADLT